MLPILLASAVIGQCHATHQHYANCGHVQLQATNYGHATTYGQTYAQNHVATAVFASDPAYFAASVAEYTKKQIQAAEALKAQVDLAAKLSKLDETVGQLTIRFGQALAQPDPAPPQQPYGVPAPPLASPQTPQYATPPVPGKNTPGYGTQAPTEPPLPTVGAAPIGPVLARNTCLKCHSGAAAAAGIALDDEAAIDLGTRVAIYRATKDGRMPPRGPKVSADDVLAIKAWIKSGLDEVAANLK